MDLHVHVYGNSRKRCQRSHFFHEDVFFSYCAASFSATSTIICFHRETSLSLQRMKLLPLPHTHIQRYQEEFSWEKIQSESPFDLWPFLHVLNWLNLAMCCLCKDQFEAYCSVFRAHYIFKKWWKKSICFSWRHINFIYDKTFSIGFEFYSQFFFPDFILLLFHVLHRNMQSAKGWIDMWLQSHTKFLSFLWRQQNEKK